MSARDVRSASRRRPISALVNACGTALRSKGRRLAGLDFEQMPMEQLEPRVMLSGDHPSFNDVFVNGVNASAVATDGTAAAGTISPAGDNDMFTFTAAQSDFVRVWADTLSSAGSTLDSRVQIYTRDPNTQQPVLVTSGSNNGLLTSGVFKDGWVGFVATAGTQYFVQVLSDAVGGNTASGGYNLRVNGTTTAFPALNATSGLGQVNGNITLRGGDVVYKVTTGNSALFDSLMTLTSTANAAQLDTRIDVYASDGSVLHLPDGTPVSDDDSGNLSNSYTAFHASKSTVYYVRVRSDQTTVGTPATGAFTLIADGIGTTIPIDPVTRVGTTGPQNLASVQRSDFYTFKSQGSGFFVISLAGAGLPPIEDSALRLYDQTGEQIAFNELPGNTSQIIIQLGGGKTFYLVVENFDGTAGGPYLVEVEAHATLAAPGGPNLPIQDDHASTPTAPIIPNSIPDLRAFEQATPIIWSAPINDPITDATWPVPNTVAENHATNHTKVVVGDATGRIFGNGDTDLFQFVPPQDMLGTFGGLEQPVPGAPPPPLDWQPKYRPATQLQILAASDAAGFLDVTIRVFDSNLNVVWTNTGLLGGQDPAGMLDPATFRKPPLGFTPQGINVWGGEVYYIEVSGNGDGRYDVQVMADAPRDTNLWNYVTTPTAAGPNEFANAMDINIDPNTGDARNYVNAAGANLQIFPPGSRTVLLTPGAGDMAANLVRAQFANRIAPTPPAAGTGAGIISPVQGDPGTRGRVIFEESDLGNIETIGDTQVYKFRALYSGEAEVRLATTQITDEFFSGVATTESNDPAQNPPPPPVITTTNLTKTYNSPLDGALRIFDNDFQQVAYNNDNQVTAGDIAAYGVASFGNQVFYQRDPRTVFNVEAGKTYYIQVESGQSQTVDHVTGQPLGTSTPAAAVDWRHATGSYELLINSMPNLLFADDHADTQQQATPMPIDLSVTSTTASLGSVDGVVNSNTDADVFIFISPSAGTATFTVATRGGDSFQRILTVVDATTGATVGTATGNGAQTASINIIAFKGQQFFLTVTGTPTVSGDRYTIGASGVPFHDDNADVNNFSNATVIDQNTYDFDKTETVSGSIETPGDTDVFAFNALTYDVATITVHSHTSTLNPFFRVYEISEDPDGHPIRLQVAYGSGTAINDATTTVSLTAPRTSLLTGHTFLTYYVVVSGVDPDVDFGDYDLTLTTTVATDDHPDLGQFSQTRDPDDTVAIGPSGTGGNSGNIELSGDTDVFQFVAAASGLVTINVVSPSDSRLHTTVQVFDSSGTPVTDLGTSGTTVTGPDNPQSIATFTFNGDRNATYYVVVGGVAAAGNTFKTDDHGTYLVNVTTQVPDDHPNEGEFPFADPIFIAGDGLGAATGTLEVLTDSDLFQFTALGDGNARITIATPSSGVSPELSLFDGFTVEIGTPVVDGGPGDEDGPGNGSVTRTIPVVTGGVYYILVKANPQQTGDYTVSVDSPRTQGSLPDDHANAGDWDHASPIPLSSLTGDGNGTGIIELSDDTDLFFFTSLSGTLLNPRPAFVQVLTPSGSVLDVGVKIYDSQHNLVTSDDQGGPGFNAGVSFNIGAANQKYFVEVDGLGNTGAYTVKVDTAPELYTLYYPEGFSNNNIREYIVVENPNTFDVTYSVKIRYETTGNLVVLADHVTLAADTRGGISISDGPNGRLPGVIVNQGYSIIVESDGFVAANISHYDFHATLGEAFTDRTSDSWSFARGDRNPGINDDFVIVYNPNPVPVIATFTAYKADGTTFQMVETIPGNTRGGWTLAGTPQLGVGQFGFTVTSQAANPGDQEIGVVASLSHYDLVNNTGYGTLGNPDGGSTTGVVPGVITGGSVSTTITFFNTTSSTANVSIVGRYIGGGLPDITKTIQIVPNGFVTMSGTDLGLTDNQLAGIRYDSDQPLSVIGGTIRPGSTPPDATTDITQANTEVGTSWFWGDAFINSRHAGTLYQENMYLYNPDVNPMTVTLKFIFDDGFTSSIDVNVGAKNFAAVALNTLPEILNHKVFNYFSVEATGATPFAAKFNHYDLVLDGAWGTRGAPLGLTDPLT